MSRWWLAWLAAPLLLAAGAAAPAFAQPTAAVRVVVAVRQRAGG